MNNPIPANPEVTQGIVQDGAQNIPQGPTQGQEPHRMDAPVSNPGDSNQTSNADNFWNALINESEDTKSFRDSASQDDDNYRRFDQPQTVNLQPTVEAQKTPAAAAQPSPQQSYEPQLLEQINKLNQNVAAMQQAVQPQVDPQQLISQAVNHLASNHYRLNDAQREALITEPETILPVIAAQLHVNLVQQLGETFRQQASQLIPQMIKSEIAASRAEQEFYGKYPGLSNPQFTPIVTNSIRLVKQLNPNAKRNEVMDLAAAAAAQTLRSAGYGDVLYGNSQQRPAPMQQQQRNPYTPAAQSVQSGQMPVQQRAQNIWSDLANDDEGGRW